MTVNYFFNCRFKRKCCYRFYTTCKQWFSTLHLCSSESFSHRLWCGWFTPCWFSPNLENTSKSPRVVLSHCLAFKSLEYLYELPIRQDADYDAEDHHSKSSTRPTYLLSPLVPGISCPGQVVSQNCGAFVPPNAVTEHGRFGELPWGQRRESCSVRANLDVPQSGWIIVLTDGNWSFVPTFWNSSFANTAPIFARRRTPFNVHLSHAPLHVDSWKLHFFYVFFTPTFVDK